MQAHRKPGSITPKSKSEIHQPPEPPALPPVPALEASGLKPVNSQPEGLRPQLEAQPEALPS